MASFEIQDISNPEYWKHRLETCPRDEKHMAIFRTTRDKWQAIEDNHRLILENNIGENESVFDCACAWGRLLSMMPSQWVGEYIGVDISPDFIRLAKSAYPRYAHNFYVGDLRQDLTQYLSPPLMPYTDALTEKIDNESLKHSLSIFPRKCDWAVLISVRPMVRRNMGGSVWDEMEKRIREVSNRILFLEYDLSKGSIE